MMDIIHLVENESCQHQLLWQAIFFTCLSRWSLNILPLKLIGIQTGRSTKKTEQALVYTLVEFAQELAVVLEIGELDENCINFSTKRTKQRTGTTSTHHN
jgi:hypothetical protein